MNVARFDKASLQPSSQMLENGFLKGKAIVTRCGIFQYMNPDGTIRNELRHPDDVLDAISLESMKMLPVTNDHPQDKLVTVENSRRLAMGYTGEMIEHDGNNILTNFVITDAELINQITKNGKNQLSLGYQTDLIEEMGEWQGTPYTMRQKNIRYNHLAVVNRARAGELAKIALDSQDAFEIDIIEKEAQRPMKTIVIDNMEMEVDEKVADSFEKLRKDLKNLEDEKKRIMDEIEMIKKKLDKTEGERDSYKEKAKESETKKDSDEFERRVRERIQLVNQASKLVDSETSKRFDSMSDLDVMKNVISFKSKSVKLDDATSEYIKARYDILCEIESEKVNTSNVEPLRKSNLDSQDGANVDLEESKKQAMSSIANAWKNEKK